MCSDSNLKVTIFANEGVAEELRDHIHIGTGSIKQALGDEQLRTKHVYTPNTSVYHDASFSKFRSPMPFTPCSTLPIVRARQTISRTTTGNSAALLGANLCRAGGFNLIDCHGMQNTHYHVHRDARTWAGSRGASKGLAFWGHGPGKLTSHQVTPI